MSKNNKWNKSEPKVVKVSDSHNVANTSPLRMWRNFDECWASCVKNGSAGIKISAEAHLKAIGCWDDQSKWVDGLIHFGIPMEK